MRLRLLCLAVIVSHVGLSADLRLIQAVKAQDEASVRALLKQHVDVNAPQGDGTAALHWAANLDNRAIADLLDSGRRTRGCSQRSGLNSASSGVYEPKRGDG